MRKWDELGYARDSIRQPSEILGGAINVDLKDAVEYQSSSSSNSDSILSDQSNSRANHGAEGGECEKSEISAEVSKSSSGSGEESSSNSSVDAHPKREVGMFSRGSVPGKHSASRPPQAADQPAEPGLQSVAEDNDEEDEYGDELDEEGEFE